MDWPCPHCEHPLTSNDEPGTEIECPNCLERVPVPSEDAATSKHGLKLKHTPERSEKRMPPMVTTSVSNGRKVYRSGIPWIITSN